MEMSVTRFHEMIAQVPKPLYRQWLTATKNM